MYKWASAACAAMLALAPADARADDTSWTFNFTHENDLFEEGHDRNYTVGQLFSLTSPPVEVERLFLYDLARRITPIDPDIDLARLEFSLSHAMFTPEDLTLVTPDPNDRPYAGLVIGSVTLMGFTENNVTLDRSEFDSVTFSIGVVGPQSGAGDLQTWWHEVIDGIEPRGWDSQIPDRWIGGVSYQSTNRFWRPSASVRAIMPFELELYTHAGFSLGTIQTNGSVGVSARIGRDPPQDYGLPRLSPAISGGGFFSRTDERGWYAFAGVEQRYVAYDVTLDEAPEGGAVTVDRRPWVTDAHVGGAYYIGWLRFGYSHIWRTETYRQQRERDAFGVVSISTHLWF